MSWSIHIWETTLTELQYTYICSVFLDIFKMYFPLPNIRKKRNIGYSIPSGLQLLWLNWKWNHVLTTVLPSSFSCNLPVTEVFALSSYVILYDVALLSGGDENWRTTMYFFWLMDSKLTAGKGTGTIWKEIAQFHDECNKFTN